MPLRTGSRASLADSVYRRLRREVLDGTLAPGSRLVEVEIGERMTASRTPVREALRRLESDGFVQRRGARLVTTPAGPDDLGDIALLRAELDGLAARLAVARASARDWERAQQAVEELRKVPADDEDALAGAHARVHSAIYALGFGPRMTLFVENHVLGYIELALSVGAGRTTAESSYRAHTALLRALASGDAAHAEEVAREHARKGSKVAVRAAGAGTVSAAPGKGPAKARI